LRKMIRLPPDQSENRLCEFQNAVYEHSDAVIALNAGDIPKGIAEERSRVIPPLFDPAPERWSYGGNNRVLFIGNINHYPNFQAVEWIATQLAPSLEKIDGNARVRVIGASADNIPAHWATSNVDYLGIGDSSLVKRLLVETDLFIAPISNRFGSKIKLLDCLSHGTPFIATEEAMSGVPFLDGVPRMRLDQPHQAAENISALLRDEASLTSLSKSLEQQLLQSLAAQKGIWGDFFDHVLHLPPARTLSPEPTNYTTWMMQRSKLVRRSATEPQPASSRAIPHKIGRNDRCPCGSGKRYKHCHGRLTS
jgi:hypothetical protein